VIVIHGGFWRAQWSLDLMTPLARDLAPRGVAAWNVEYRRVGGGGGWPATFQDMAAAIDVLMELLPRHPLLLNSVAAVGHSAGGHLALWAAARPRLPDGAPGAHPLVRIQTAVSLGGVADLEAGTRANLGDGAVAALLDGLPSGPAGPRYALVSPAALLPFGVRQLIVHGERDSVVPIDHARNYARTAAAVGDPVELMTWSQADHFSVIDPASASWRSLAPRLVGAVRPRPAPS